MPLKFVNDVLDNETHARLDRDVVQRAHRLEDPLRLSDYVLLLAYIVSESDGRIDPKYTSIDKADELVGEVLTELKVAWKTKSFKKIRNLGANSPLYQLSTITC